MTTYIVPYKQTSAGANRLAGSFPCNTLPNNQIYAALVRSSDRVINWGCTQLHPTLMSSGADIYNAPSAVADVTDKIKFFRKADSFRVPTWTTDRDVAQGWLGDGHTVVQRLLTRASGGRGIEMRDEGPLDPAPLYTQFVPNDREFRIHFMAGDIIQKQEKKKKRDWDGIRSPYIRNHSNGYVLAFRDISVPSEVIDQAEGVIQDLDLDFGAIDIIYQESEDKAYVLETNSAPGITGTTVEIYKNSFRTYYEC